MPRFSEETATPTSRERSDEYLGSERLLAVPSCHCPIENQSKCSVPSGHIHATAATIPATKSNSSYLLSMRPSPCRERNTQSPCISGWNVKTNQRAPMEQHAPSERRKGGGGGAHTHDVPHPPAKSNIPEEWMYNLAATGASICMRQDGCIGMQMPTSDPTMASVPGVLHNKRKSEYARRGPRLSSNFPSSRGYGWSPKTPAERKGERGTKEHNPGRGFVHVQFCISR